MQQDVKKLIESTFERPLFEFPLERSISKAEENILLVKFNRIIEELSNKHHINQTLLFSKKFQKEFLRSVFISGLEGACKTITNWREELIKDKLLELLK